MWSSIMDAVGAVTGTCSRAGCVLGPQDRRGSAVRADVEAMARSGGAGGVEAGPRAHGYGGMACRT